MNDIQTQVYQLLANANLSRNAIAGMMGNIDKESSFNPRIIEGGGESDNITVDGTHGYGLFQYTSADRQQKVADMSAKMNLPASDPRVQVATMISEMGPEGIAKLNSMKDPRESAQWFHDTYIRSADGQEGLKYRGDKAVEYAGANFDVPVGDSKVSIPANFNVEDPNEQLDINTAMSILNMPKRNVADAGMQALQEQLLNQAHHRARGRLAAGFYQDSDQAMMKAAVAKAEEEAKMQNQTTQLTGAGKLAEMIAKSKNNNNRAAYASFGALVGMTVNPMQGQYMGYNQAAQLGLNMAIQERNYQRAKQDQIEAENRAEARSMRAAALTASFGGRGGGGGHSSSGGGGSKYSTNGYTRTQYDAAKKETAKTMVAAQKALQEKVDEGYAHGWNPDGPNPVTQWAQEWGGIIAALPDIPEKEEAMKQADNWMEYANSKFVEAYGQNYEKMKRTERS